MNVVSQSSFALTNTTLYTVYTGIYTSWNISLPVAENAYKTTAGTQFFMVRSDIIDLRIDSLPCYEIIKELPVKVECLNDDEFLAEIPDVNIGMTGDTVSEAFRLLKEHVQAVFRRYKSKEKLGPEPSRQLKYLEQYIGGKKQVRA
jgi:hypothetical protein